MKKGTTLQFNPSFAEDIIGACVRRPREGAEYLSRWRDDLSITQTYFDGGVFSWIQTISISEYGATQI
jgi:hypothetical protein